MGACHPRRGGEIPSRKTANVITWWFYYRISQTSCALIGADSGRVNISSGWGGKESTPVGLQGIFQRQGGLNGNKPLPLPRTDCLGHKELRRHWFLYLIRLPALSLSLSLSGSLNMKSPSALTARQSMGISEGARLRPSPDSPHPDPSPPTGISTAVDGPRGWGRGPGPRC